MSEMLEQFPEFDYRSPREPWRINIQAHASLAAMQIQAFHYYWTTQAARSGHIGLSLTTPDLPFCFTVSTDDVLRAHCRVSPWKAREVLSKESFSCVVASAILSEVPCVLSPSGTNKERARLACVGTEVKQAIVSLLEFLMPGGVMIGALLDNECSMRVRGTNLIEECGFQHAWGADMFRDKILSGILEQNRTIELLEFDTLKNDLAFNFVLKKGS